MLHSIFSYITDIYDYIDTTCMSFGRAQISTLMWKESTQRDTYPKLSNTRHCEHSCTYAFESPTTLTLPSCPGSLFKGKITWKCPNMCIYPCSNALTAGNLYKSTQIDAKVCTTSQNCTLSLLVLLHPTQKQVDEYCRLPIFLVKFGNMIFKKNPLWG